MRSHISSHVADLNTVRPINHRDEHTHMNLQRQGRCPGVELAAECELSPRGEGANKTQHNTNKPLGWCEPASQPAGWAGSRAHCGNQLGQWIELGQFRAPNIAAEPLSIRSVYHQKATEHHSFKAACDWCNIYLQIRLYLCDTLLAIMHYLFTHQLWR